MPLSLNDPLCRANQGGIAQYRIFCKQYNQSLFIAHQLLDQILCKDVKTLVISYLMELQFLPELKADQKTDHTYLYKSRTFLYRFSKMMQCTRDSKFDPTLRDYYFWIACFFNKIQSLEQQYFLNFYSDSIRISSLSSCVFGVREGCPPLILIMIHPLTCGFPRFHTYQFLLVICFHM